MTKIRDIELGKMAVIFQDLRKAVDERERCLREAFELSLNSRYGYFDEEITQLRRRLKSVSDLEGQTKALMMEFERSDSVHIVAGLPKVQ